MISGINHITLSIKDVNESFNFYRDVLEFKPLARWPEGAYFLAGDMWMALVLDENLRKSSLPEYTHIAFTIAPKDFERLGQQIVDSQAKIWQKNWTEGDSLYFVDPNGHKLEIHASDVETRLKEAKKNPWPGLEFFV